MLLVIGIEIVLLNGLGYGLCNENSLGTSALAESEFSNITSIAFIFLSVVQYKKSGKTKETIYLSLLSIFFLFSYFAIISVG